MIVLRKTMDSALEAERKSWADRLSALAAHYGDALNRVSALQVQLSAWVLNRPENITPEQMAQMFYAQDDDWQARFFNCMQEQVQANHDALPPTAYGMSRRSAGVPAGEGQWFYAMAKLNDSGFETLEAMYEHAVYHRNKESAQ